MHAQGAELFRLVRRDCQGLVWVSACASCVGGGWVEATDGRLTSEEQRTADPPGFSNEGLGGHKAWVRVEVRKCAVHRTRTSSDAKALRSIMVIVLRLDQF